MATINSEETIMGMECIHRKQRKYNTIMPREQPDNINTTNNRYRNGNHYKEGRENDQLWQQNVTHLNNTSAQNNLKEISDIDLTTKQILEEEQCPRKKLKTTEDNFSIDQEKESVEQIIQKTLLKYVHKHNKSYEISAHTGKNEKFKYGTAV
ncbi:hypothetical protein QE152_g4147 [Popillia japonica]|uniref:Uncharacterized protein n=1 Tax=Popillia japonica TaxID=7064 RepID=A0AAW1N1Q6_POPJA